MRNAPSSVVVGEVMADPSGHLAQGTVVRSVARGVRIAAGSMVLENSVVVGRPDMPAAIGARVVFGHRCLVVGAEVGDLCEIGNGSVLLPGARLGDRVFTGEGCVIPPGMVVPHGSVVVGNPGRCVRQATAGDMNRLLALRDGDLSIPPSIELPFSDRAPAGATMGTTYEYKGTWPTVDETAVVFASAELTGDVQVGPRTIIGSGVRIIGDSHGPVRVGADVQILENTVLHLLPDNELVVEDGVIIGPGCMIHGCHLGAGTVVEPGANVCDWSRLGPGCLVGAGAVVKQRSRFDGLSRLDGFPAKLVGKLDAPPPLPRWALQPGDLDTLVAR